MRAAGALAVARASAARVAKSGSWRFVGARGTTGATQNAGRSSAASAAMIATVPSGRVGGGGAGVRASATSSACRGSATRLPVVPASANASVSRRGSRGDLATRRASSSSEQGRQSSSTYPQLRVSAPGRVVAIGDLHGDIGQARRALRIAGVLDEGGDTTNPKWIGGDTTLVQLGDILDRGDDEIGILILLQKLDKEARKQGGGVYVLNGNHEVLNISGDFRYVSRGAFGESARFSEHLVKLFGDKFRDAFGIDEEDAWTRQSKARVGLFSPGGPLAQQLSQHHTVLIVNDTVFAHGGLVPRHVEFGLDRLNRAVSDWMRGKEIEDEETRMALGMAIGGVRDSIVWHRAYGTENFPTDEDRMTSCELLEQTLGMIDGVKRLVVGHTPQLGGANCECCGKIWRIDVGMSFGVLGADPQVLEIDGEDVRVLTKSSVRETTKA